MDKEAVEFALYAGAEDAVPVAPILGMHHGRGVDNGAQGREVWHAQEDLVSHLGGQPLERGGGARHGDAR